MKTFKEFLAETGPASLRFPDDPLGDAANKIQAQMNLGPVFINYGPNLATPDGKVEYTIRFRNITKRITQEDLMFEVGMMKRAIAAAFRPRGVAYRVEHPAVHTGEAWRSWEEVLKRKGLGRGTQMVWSVWVDTPK